MKNANDITNKLYAAYGTDSGILFGIKERQIVEAIVKFTMAEILLDELTVHEIDAMINH